MKIESEEILEAMVKARVDSALEEVNATILKDTIGSNSNNEKAMNKLLAMQKVAADDWFKRRIKT